jgi:hypothetical protein
MTLSWTDKSLSETAFVVQKSTDGGLSWTDLTTVNRLLFDSVTGVPIPNTVGDVLTYADPAWTSGTQYRVRALNEIGYAGSAGAFMQDVVQSAWMVVATA